MAETVTTTASNCLKRLRDFCDSSAAGPRRLATAEGIQKIEETARMRPGSEGEHGTPTKKKLRVRLSAEATSRPSPSTSVHSSSGSTSSKHNLPPISKDLSGASASTEINTVVREDTPSTYDRLPVDRT